MRCNICYVYVLLLTNAEKLFMKSIISKFKIEDINHQYSVYENLNVTNNQSLGFHNF